MAKCIYCQQKKGKRSCPALSGMICSGCCGEHRGRAISCPSDCPYFVDHEAYQRERLGVLFIQERQRLYPELERCGGKKAVQLLHLCDVVTHQFFYSKPGTLDWELLAGLEDVRRRLSPISVQAAGPTAFGEILGKEVQEFCKQEQVPLDLAAEAMDHIIRFFKDFSGADLRSSRYWRGLVGFIDHFYPALTSQMKESSSERGRIILPSTPVGTSREG